MNLVGKGMGQTTLLWISVLCFLITSPGLYSLESAPTKPRISVIPGVNATGQKDFDAEAIVLFDTVDATLRQTKSVQTVAWTGIALGVSAIEELASEARRRSLDAVILIRLENASPDGAQDTVVCRVSVFDRARGGVTIDRRSPPAKLGGFLNASNLTVSAVLSALTGTPIGLGVIDLENVGEKGSYEILLDGRAVPEEQLSLVPSGSHDLVVRQKRLLEDLVLISTNIQVKEHKTARVTFSVPYLTSEEQTKADQLAKAVEQLWNDPDAGTKMDNALADQESFFEDIRCSPRLAVLRKASEDNTSEWPAQQERLREQVIWASKHPIVPLELQRQTLTEQKQSMEEKRSWVGWIGIGGWIVASVGAGIVGYSWFPANAALNSYNSSTTQSGWDGARGQMNTANRVLSIGLGVGITGLAVGVMSLFLEPDTSKIDKQIKVVDQKISLFGAQK